LDFIASYAACLFADGLLDLEWNKLGFVCSTSSMKTPTTQKFRHAIGSVDTDSEEDVEIDTLATLTSMGVTIRHQAFPSPAKRSKTNHSGQAETTTVIPLEDATAVNTPHVKESPAEEKRKNQVRFS
jgi:hypothetical protein